MSVERVCMSLVVLGLMVGLTGCSHLASVSTTTVPADRSKAVEVEAERLMIFLVNFDNDYVNTLTEGLAAKCPNGRVEGVLTKMENVTYFPLIAHSVKVTARGYCVEGGSDATATR